MRKSALQFTKTETRTDEELVTVDQLPRLVEDWLADCQIRQHSSSTIELRRTLLGRLQWFLNDREATLCGRSELRSFLAYLSSGHQDADGRWGKGKDKRWSRPLRPASVNTYYHHIRAFFSWLVSEELIGTSPMEKIAPPVMREDQVTPFTKQQVEALVQAARRSKYPRRDEAIIRFLLDTGVRVTELCEMKMRDIDLLEGQARILGKGNKFRVICFGRRTARALRNYLREDERMPDETVFLSERGENAGSKFTRSGVLQLVERLGRVASIHGVRCSPHTFRHTFAVEFLRNGGNVFTLKQLLGHAGLQVTNRYVALAQADIQAQHRQFSPGDRV